MLVVEPGQAHKWWNAGEEELVFRCEVRPALGFESLIETMFALAAAGKTNKKGMPNPFRLAVIAQAHLKAMFRVRSSNEPLVILDSLAEMQEILQQIERAAVEEARSQGATWSQVAEALNRTRQAVEQRFG
jgi:hypothetical protein